MIGTGICMPNCGMTFAVTVVRVSADEATFPAAVEVFRAYQALYGHVLDVDAVRSWLAAQVSSQRMRVYLAHVDDGGALTPAGVMTVVPIPASLRLGVFWNVRDLFVSPEHRRGGVARALLDAVQADARSQGCLRLSLQTESDNVMALQFYRGYGFEPVSGLDSLILTLRM